MYGLLICIAAAAVFMYIVMPILVRRKMLMAANPVFEPSDPEDPRIPADVKAFWREVSPSLAAVGFTPTSCLLNHLGSGDCVGYIAMFVNRAVGDEAAAYVIVAQASPAPARYVYTVEFSTDLADGRSVCTNNCDQLSSGFPPPWRTTGRVPRLADLAQLFRVHQSLTSRHGGAKKALTASSGQAESMRASTLREYQTWVDAGHYYRHERRNQLRLTWKGGFLHTWAQLWPVTTIRRWLMGERARRLLQDAGLPTHYRTVDYAKLAKQRATEAPPATAENAGALQFDRAESVQPSAPTQGVTCAACSRPVTASYYEVNGSVTCPECRETLAHPVGQGSRIGRTFRAALAGSAAGLLGAGIYFAVAAITGYELGLIALVVGLLVGGAIRWGCRARGGWFYQLLAIILTYVAVGASHSAMAIREMILHPELMERLAAATSAPAEADLLADRASQPSERSAESKPTTQPALGRRALRWLVFLAFMVVCLPVVIGVESKMSLLITGIALYEAWKINKRPPQRISGPYAVAAATPAQPSTPEGGGHG